jgi:hypothetical protein
LLPADPPPVDVIDSVDRCRLMSKNRSPPVGKYDDDIFLDDCEQQTTAADSSQAKNLSNLEGGLTTTTMIFFCAVQESSEDG